MKRIWDPEGKYKEGFVKEYNHWILEVSFRQHTLGCFIIFAKKDIEKFSELSEQEVKELPLVMKDSEGAVSKLFNPGRFNYLQMGNAIHHLHFHEIPRYEKEVEFDGKVWVDNAWGHPPVWKKTEDDLNLVIKIRDLIKKELT